MVFCGQCGVEQPNDKVKFCAECKAPMGGTPAPSAPALNERPPAFNPSSVQASAGPPDPKETPPGCFLVKIPDGVPPGQVVTCTVPAPYPQAGQAATFVVPAVGIAGHEGYVYAALPFGGGGAAQSQTQPHAAGAPASQHKRTVTLSLAGAGTRGENLDIAVPIPSGKWLFETGKKAVGAAKVAAKELAPVAAVVARGVARSADMAANQLNQPNVRVVHIQR